MTLISAISVLVIAEPGFFRDGILAILNTYDSIHHIDVFSNGQYQEDTEQYSPDIILFDCSSRELPCEAIKRMKVNYPNSRLIVLIDSIENVHSTKKQAADMVLTKGFTGQELYKVILEVLTSQSADANLVNPKPFDCLK